MTRPARLVRGSQWREPFYALGKPLVQQRCLRSKPYPRASSPEEEPARSSSRYARHCAWVYGRMPNAELMTCNEHCSCARTDYAVREESLILASLSYEYASQGRTADALLAIARAEAIQERIGAHADGVLQQLCAGFDLASTPRLRRRVVGVRRAHSRTANAMAPPRFAPVLHQGVALCGVLGGGDIDAAPCRSPSIA